MKQNYLLNAVSYSLFALAVLSIVLLTAGSVIWADISVRTGNLGIGTGSVIVVTCLYMSYILLGAGLYKDEKSEKFSRLIFTLGAVLPAVISAIGIGLTSTIFRSVLVVSAGLLGIGLSSFWKSKLQRLDSKFYKIDTVRQGIVMLIIGIMSMIYVSIPAMQINIFR
jgi:hypothetical protein